MIKKNPLRLALHKALLHKQIDKKAYTDLLIFFFGTYDFSSTREPAPFFFPILYAYMQHFHEDSYKTSCFGHMSELYDLVDLGCCITNCNTLDEQNELLMYLEKQTAIFPSPKLENLLKSKIEKFAPTKPLAE